MTPGDRVEMTRALYRQIRQHSPADQWQARVLAERLIDLGWALPVDPLGYLVLSRNPDSGRLQPHGRVHPTRELAENWKQHLETSGGPRIPIRSGTSHLVAGVWEDCR